jgi:predicted PurR-regulated permease PerM
MDNMKEKLNQPIAIQFTTGGIIKTLVILFLAYLLFLLRDLFLIILTSVVIASAVEPATRWFIKKRIPRPLAVIMLYLFVFVGITAVITTILPPLAHDVKTVIMTLPQYINNINSIDLEKIPGLSLVFNQFTSSFQSGELIKHVGGYGGQATFGFFQTAGTIFGSLLSFMMIIVISFYLAVQDDGVTSFLRVVTPIKHEKYIIDLWKRSQKKIGQWMQGQLLLGVIVGVLTYLGLSILGVENALLLALVAAVFELIPIFGPILSAIPAIGVALIQDGFSFALVTLGLYLIIQQFENHLIHPLVVKKIIGIPSLLAILSLIVGAQLAGFLGMIIAVPVAAALMEYLSDIEKEKVAELEKLNLESN